MNRRGFLKAILAAGVAPYVVTSAGVLMPTREIQRIAYIWGDGIHDDTEGLQAFFNGKEVQYADGLEFDGVLRNGIFVVSQTIQIAKRNSSLRGISGSTIKSSASTVFEFKQGSETNSLISNYIIWDKP